MAPHALSAWTEKDKACKVMCKLSALSDLLAHYALARHENAPPGDALSGVGFILAGCVDDLREIIDDNAPDAD